MLKKFIITITISPFILLITLLRPIVIVRFGFIDAARIGHLCNRATHIINRDVEKKNRKTIDVLMYSQDTCNEYLKAAISKRMFVFEFNRIIAYIINFIKNKPFFLCHIVKFPPQNLRLFGNEKNALSFSNDEKEQGGKLLEQLGIPQEAKWVCIHNRDSAYLDSAYPGRDWGYHDYRDFDVEDLLPAAEELVSRGYYVVRMGSAIAKPMQSNNPAIIDYASHPAQSDFADIFLLGGCDFYLGSDSGIFAVCPLYNKPFAFVNFPVLETLCREYYWSDIPFILKRMKDNKTGDYLSLKTIADLGLDMAVKGDVLETAGVKLIVNTPEEIKQLAIEVDERVNGKWVSTNKDKTLQQEYWNTHDKHVKNSHIDENVAQIGAHFLRNHTDLLN